MPRILFVDDNKDVLETASSILNKLGYDVVTAVNGAEAMDRFNESSFDAVVTDLIMPGTNGFELVKHIRDTASQPIPAVIAMTGTAWNIDMTCFDLVLEKPFSIKKLIECLKNFENNRK